MTILTELNQFALQIAPKREAEYQSFLQKLNEKMLEMEQAQNNEGIVRRKEELKEIIH